MRIGFVWGMGMVRSQSILGINSANSFPRASLPPVGGSVVLQQLKKSPQLHFRKFADVRKLCENTTNWRYKQIMRTGPGVGRFNPAETMCSANRASSATATALVRPA